MRVVWLMSLFVIIIAGGCRKKKTVLKDEAIVETKVLVNESSITDVNNSNIEDQLIRVEGKMIRISNAVDAMEVDTLDPEIKGLMSKANRGLKDARQDLGQVIRRMERNEIPKAEEKLKDVISDLGELEQELADSGY